MTDFLPHFNNLQDGDLIYLENGSWRNRSKTEAGISAVGHGHTVADLLRGTYGQQIISGNGTTLWASVPKEVIMFAAASATGVWTDMPLAEDFFLGTFRQVQKVDLTYFNQVRLCVTKTATAGAAASKLIAKYRTSFSTTPGLYSNIGTSEVSVAVNTTNTVIVSSWIDLATAAKDDVFITINGSGGDGALDPAFGTISIQFR